MRNGSLFINQMGRLMKQRTIKKRERIEHAANFPLSYKARKVYVYSITDVKDKPFIIYTCRPTNKKTKSFAVTLHFAKISRELLTHWEV